MKGGRGHTFDQNVHCDEAEKKQLVLPHGFGIRTDDLEGVKDCRLARL